MKTVKEGSVVKVNFTGTLEDGSIFATTEEEGPLEVEVGAGNVIKGFEDALVGMTETEKKSITLTPEEAFGQRDENMQQNFNQEDLPEGFNPDKGEMVTLQTSEGKDIPGLVTHSDEERITVDLNHPLAGKDLVFDIEVVEINEGPSEIIH